MKKDFRKDAKVLLLDLEVGPSLMYAYGYYEPKVVKVVEQPILLSIAWKWLGEKEVHCLTLEDCRLVDTKNDKLLVDKLWQLLDECQVAVAYNGKQFDQKMANTFFIRHNMTPPSPYKEFDPLQTARRYFKFGSNKLDYVSKLLVGDGKTEQTYGDCWEDLLLGDKKARKRASKIMARYNAKDVEILEKVYNKLIPWATNHPNMALHAGRPTICPRCGHEASFKIKAYRRTGVQVNAVQYECLHCHAYVTRPLDKDERLELDAQGLLKSKYRNLGA